MKTNIKIIIVLLVLSTYMQSFSQITNGSFEEWEMVENYQEPIGWETNQDTFSTKIYMDSMSVEGNYSARLESLTESAFLMCRSQLTINSKVDNPEGNITSISFYLRSLASDPEEGGFFSFFMRPYANGVSSSPVIWQTDEDYPDFAKIELDISEPNIDSVYIEYVAGPIGTAVDGCALYTTAWIDNIQFNSEMTSTKQIPSNSAFLYPNPTDGNIRISDNKENYNRYTIIDLLGRKVEEGDILNGQFYIQTQGSFFVELRNSNNMSISKMHRVVVLK